MGNIFSNFFISLKSKKNKYLPAGTADETNFSIYNSKPVNSMFGVPKNAKIVATNPKKLAMFDLNIEKPKYEGAIPEATIKFYPLD